jgi:hypothetical protein
MCIETGACVPPGATTPHSSELYIDTDSGRSHKSRDRQESTKRRHSRYDSVGSAGDSSAVVPTRRGWLRGGSPTVRVTTTAPLLNINTLIPRQLVVSQPAVVFDEKFLEPAGLHGVRSWVGITGNAGKARRKT